MAFKYDPKTISKLAQFDQMKSERDFYYQKVRDIDHVLDVYKESSVETLIQTIKEILYLPPDKIAMVTDNGQVVIKGAYEDDFNQKENINANFLGVGVDDEFMMMGLGDLNDLNADQSAMGNFGDLLSEKMELEG